MIVALTGGRTTFVRSPTALSNARNEHLRRRARTPARREQPGTDLGALVDELFERVAPDSTDDIAVLALHWRGRTASSATDVSGADQAS
jgi:hypothetical protein